LFLQTSIGIIPAGSGLLHHGTLLVTTELEKIDQLLKPGGKSRIAQVTNLADIVSGITMERVEELLFAILAGEIPESHFDIS